MTMRNRLIMTAAAVMVLITIAFADVWQVSAAENAAGEPKTGKRTVLVYICGSNLETQTAMATHNIKQILKAKFSKDGDVRVIIMTGGANRWRTKSNLLVFPDGVNTPDGKNGISSNYNQIWEAKGADALDENAGKLVLLDGDGVTGSEGEAVTAKNEIMSDPKVLKAFLNYGAKNYPAEKYDLILWDHGGGPTGGFGVDEHDQKRKTMSFSGIVDALSDNAVVDRDGDGTKDGKFDFVDFDACLMSSIELQLVLADYTDYYISSPETEPGFGQYYTGWLNMAGEDPDVDTFELGKKVVDDFIWFYEEGGGLGQDGTLTVTDTQKFINSGIVEVLADLNTVMKSQVENRLFYDEFRSTKGSIRYGDDNFFDLGNLASLLSVRTSEVSEEELAGDGDISDDNAYQEKDLAVRICKVLKDLDDNDMIYGRGTEGIVSRDQYIRNLDGGCELTDLYTSGVHIFFPTPEYLSDTMNYYDEMKKVIEYMPDQKDGRYDFLNDYRKTVIDYALVELTGRAVNRLINYEKMDKNSIGYPEVRNFWRGGSDDPSALEYTMWATYAEPLLKRKDSGEEGAAEWLDSLVKQQAEEALSAENVSAKEVRTKTGTGFKIHITDVRNRYLSGIRRGVTAELPVLEDYMEEYFDGEGREALESYASISLGWIDGEHDYLSDLDIDSSASDVIRWMNQKESSWDISPMKEKWYAIKDAEDQLHVAAIDYESSGSYAVCGVNVSEGASGTYETPSGELIEPVILYFDKVQNSSEETRESRLSEITFLEKNGSERSVKVEELAETVVIKPVIYVNYWNVSDFFLPISNSAITISPENAGSITMSYTDVGNIKDIQDIDGDRKALHSRFIVSDIYGGLTDISAQVAKADEKLVQIDLTRLKTGTYNEGKPVSPEVIYNGETLEEGEDKDYTWTYYDPEKDEDVHELTECGTYSLLIKGHGRFTGYASKDFQIVLAEDAAQDMIYRAQEELAAAAEAVKAAKESGDQDALISAYERLVAAQNAVADAQAEYNRTKEALEKEKQEELEEQISMLEDEVTDLTNDLNDALVIDISNFAVTMAPSFEFDNCGSEVPVSVAGLDPADYYVYYKDNWEIGTAKVIIKPKSRKYKGEIVRTYQIVPKKVDPDVTLSQTSYTYDGKAKTPSVKVFDEDGVYTKNKDYIVTYPKGRKNAGTYKVTVKMTGYYAGTVTRTFTIAKANNTLKAKGRSAGVKYSKLKKKAQTLKASRVIKITNKGQGKKSYQLASAKKGSKNFRKYFRINARNGKMTVKKGLKKGTYTVKVKVKAAGSRNYKKAVKTVTVTIKVN